QIFVCYVCCTKIGENSDMSRCFEDFLSQALGFLTRNCAAELRLFEIFYLSLQRFTSQIAVVIVYG
ncbi:hypothetical protein, partial [Prevotella fusca]|uniref:hypothetical protein n=1 Tax=Prevotella fusca TaxID=589436 RepID=UPI003F9EDD8C